MVLTKDNLDTELFTEVRSKIVAGLSADSIVASVNAVYNGKVNSKPSVVIEPLAESLTLNKFNDTAGRSEIVVNVRVFSNKTTLELDTVASSVKKALRADDIDGIAFQNMTTSYDFQELNDTPYHAKALSVSYLFEG
jgi:predicted RND superfamily exporter protein